MTLYELTDEYVELLYALEDPEEDEEKIDILLDELEDELEVKLDTFGKIIRELEGDLVKVKSELEFLNAKKKRIDNSITFLKNASTGVLNLMGTKKLKTENFSFNIQKNGGSAPVIVDVDVEELPDDLVIITEKPNLKALAEKIKDGGCEYAHFGERGESLRIK